MDIGSILIGIAIAIVAIAYVTKPIFDHQGRGVTVEDRKMSELKANRDRIISSIQELEMDYAMGKISAKDYQAQRNELISAGAGVLREIDELGGGDEVHAMRDLDAEIESAVSRLRESDVSSDMVFCPHCGEPVASDDKFCTHCGESLENTEVRE